MSADSSPVHAWRAAVVAAVIGLVVAPLLQLLREGASCSCIAAYAAATSGAVVSAAWLTRRLVSPVARGATVGRVAMWLLPPASLTALGAAAGCQSVSESAILYFVAAYLYYTQPRRELLWPRTAAGFLWLSLTVAFCAAILLAGLEWGRWVVRAVQSRFFR